MWGKKNKVWLEFRRDILSADIPSGVFLADYLRHLATGQLYIKQMEVIDLQRYKVLKHPGKIRSILREPVFTPFVFVVCKN